VLEDVEAWVVDEAAVIPSEEALDVGGDEAVD